MNEIATTMYNNQDIDPPPQKNQLYAIFKKYIYEETVAIIMTIITVFINDDVVVVLRLRT
jgi:hypothetical protein